MASVRLPVSYKTQQVLQAPEELLDKLQGQEVYAHGVCQDGSHNTCKYSFFTVAGGQDPLKNWRNHMTWHHKGKFDIKKIKKYGKLLHSSQEGWYLEPADPPASRASSKRCVRIQLAVLC